jgi:hypothetical protein
MPFQFIISPFSVEEKTEEIQENKRFGPRTYFKLDVSQTCKVVFCLNQESENETGVRETRPNIDLGLALMQKSKKGMGLVCYVEPKKQRQIYLEMSLDAGEYYFVPKTSGVNLLNKNEKNKKIIGNLKTESDSKEKFNPELLDSILEDYFRKLDLSKTGILSENKLKLIKPNFISNMKEMHFADILQNYELKTPNGTASPGLTMRGFKRLFKSMISTCENKNEVNEMMFNLGYNEELFSFKSRLSVFNIFSTKKVFVKSRDAIKGLQKIYLFNFR